MGGQNVRISIGKASILGQRRRLEQTGDVLLEPWDEVPKGGRISIGKQTFCVRRWTFGTLG